MSTSIAVLKDTLKKSKASLATTAAAILCFGAVYYLYDLPAEPFLYAAVLLAFFGILRFAVSFASGLKKARRRRSVLYSDVNSALPIAETLAEADYLNAVQELRDELYSLRLEYENRRNDEIDYYTTWVHQIKTPISVMRMELGDGSDESSKQLLRELFRIESYADMVLLYIRLGSRDTDLVIADYPLDDMIREVIRKYAPLFIAKKLRLLYDGTDKIIVTDKKWFSAVLEQLLSNAVKYTPSGTIEIGFCDNMLNIRDSGIGISAEDLPRIFEKGYTGQNGRLDKRSSGLGLYLCKKSADLLKIPLFAESTVGEGSTFSLDLSGKIKTK